MGEPGPRLGHVVAALLDAGTDRRFVAELERSAAISGAAQKRRVELVQDGSVTRLADVTGWTSAIVPPGRSTAAAFAQPTFGSTQWNDDAAKTAS